MAGGSEPSASARRNGKPRAIAVGVALVLLVGALGINLSRTGTGAAAQASIEQQSGSGSDGGIPAAMAGFVAAYGRGDFATMQRLASPLYFVEWERQGVTLTEQAKLLQGHQRSPSGDWLFFSYATGFVDGRGFGHYLYVGHSISGSGSPSVWRVDTDSSGRVIWIEMVWLFSSQSSSVEALPPGSAQADSNLQSRIPSSPADVVFGVRFAGGLEGYYGVGQQPGVERAVGGPDNVQFYILDNSGSWGIASWSYGERFPNRPLAGTLHLQPDQASVLSSYLASIH